VLLACDDGFDRTYLKFLAVTDKRLRTVAFPLLVRRWRNDRGSSYFGKLALHL
jgi:hypothetical protein